MPRKHAMRGREQTQSMLLAPRYWLRRNATMPQKPRIAIDPHRLSLVRRHSCVATLRNSENHWLRDHMIAPGLRRGGPLGPLAGDQELPNRHVHRPDVS